MGEQTPLQATIAYFQAIQAGTATFGGRKTCPLCVAQGAAGCTTCPIITATGKPCSMQAIGTWSRHVVSAHSAKALPYSPAAGCAECASDLAAIVTWLQGITLAST
jgi:hypothetical protein